MKKNEIKSALLSISDYYPNEKLNTIWEIFCDN